MLYFALLYVTVLAFWLSVGCTEGWKWRHADGKPDTNKLVTMNTYHLWRSLTTACYLGTSALFILIEGHSIAVPLTMLAVANIAGWTLYERVMSYVELDEFWADRGTTWHLTGKINITRLPTKGDALVFIVATCVYFGSYVFWGVIDIF